MCHITYIVSLIIHAFMKITCVHVGFFVQSETSKEGKLKSEWVIKHKMMVSN